MLLCPLRRGGGGQDLRRSQRAEEQGEIDQAAREGPGPANGSQEGAVRGGRRRRCAAAASASGEAPAGGTGSQQEQPRAAAAAVAEALPSHRPRCPLLETTVRAFSVSPSLSLPPSLSLMFHAALVQEGSEHGQGPHLPLADRSRGETIANLASFPCLVCFHFPAVYVLVRRTNSIRPVNRVFIVGKQKLSGIMDKRDKQEISETSGQIQIKFNLNLSKFKQI